MKEIAHKLTAKINGTVTSGELLSRHTSFKIGGPADLFVKPENSTELITVLKILQQESIPAYILGNGTNLLVSDAGYRGAVIRLAGQFTHVEYDGETVIAGAAVPLAKLAKNTCELGLAGLEFAAGIPGSLGGALVMNAGAHGSAVSNVLLEAKILDSKLQLQTFAAGDLGLSYRKSMIPSGSVVCAVKLGLQRGNREPLKETCRNHLAFRRERQPRQPNAGSIFKNPLRDNAGRLIEACGLKGHRAGGAAISELHANFIVNEGGAKASDVLSLIHLAQQEVAKQFGIQLELEIRLLGY
jgi:UDP-N-acetylmuramate dehydrogenase